MAVNGVALAALGSGVVLLWSAIQNQHITTTVQDLVKGQQPTAGPGQTDASSTPSATASTGTSAGDTSAASAPSNPTGNVALGKMLAAARGWTGSEWNALYALWERESGWSNTARNSSSGAYGIAQALGHGPTNQYPAGAANPPPAGTSDPTAQIEWGLGYIAATYQTPSRALAHENSAGSY